MMQITSFLLLLAGHTLANPIANYAARATAPAPFCSTNTKVAGAIASISSDRPHPTAFCSAYLNLGISTITKTIRETSPPIPITLVSVATSTTIALVTSTTVTSLTLITTCAAGNTVNVPDRRAAAPTKYAASIVSSACSCIGPKSSKTTITTTNTVLPRPRFDITLTTSTTTTTAVATSTTSVGTYATSAPFRLQVSDDSKDLQNGNFLDMTGLSSGSYAQWAASSDTLYNITPCGELVVVGGSNTAAGSYAADYGSCCGTYIGFFNPDSIRANGFQPWQCSLDGNGVLTCTVNDQNQWGSSLYEAPAIHNQYQDWFGTLTLTAVFE